MKRPILPLLALGATLFTAVVVLGQAPAASTAPVAKPQKLIKVATITGAQANKEFQGNVQLLQTQRQAAIELTEAIKKEKDAKKKIELQTQLDAIAKKLNENNTAMQKAYGFSLTRNYTMEVEVANIYLQVTDEEAAKIEQAAKAEQSSKAPKK